MAYDKDFLKCCGCEPQSYDWRDAVLDVTSVLVFIGAVVWAVVVA